MYDIYFTFRDGSRKISEISEVMGVRINHSESVVQIQRRKGRKGIVIGKLISTGNSFKIL